MLITFEGGPYAGQTKEKQRLKSVPIRLSCYDDARKVGMNGLYERKDSTTMVWRPITPKDKK